MAESEAPKSTKIQSATSSPARQVTPFWKEKYERDAKKYWDLFYKRHQDKFFKDRHYLDKEWGDYFQDRNGGKLVVFEVGCGAGNTIFPLVSQYPHIFVQACDFSSRAIDLVKGHNEFSTDKVNAFVCDLTSQDLCEIMEPSSVDIVTMIFVLSAVAPEKMPLFLKNIRKVLRPNGRVLFRDYATGDLAQERLSDKQQKIGENFFVRGDGTRAYYFSTDFLKSLFMQNGFDVEKINICNKQVENRSKELVMNRRWIQAVFSSEYEEKIEDISLTNKSSKNQKIQNDTEVDLSDSMVAMFDMLPSINEVIEITVRGCSFKIKALAREYQHTCKSTGLMLWESARLMCNLIAETPSVVEGRSVLELGCGSAGICSMVSAQFAKVVVATDGDVEALNLLKENVSSNLDTALVDKIAIRRLIWGNKEDMKITKDLTSNGVGFEVIIGTDVTYNHDAISPLFETARELISCQDKTDIKPALILCHMQRRVDEGSILSTATQFGFRLVDKWVNNGVQSSDGIISSWFTNHSGYLSFFISVPLTIMFFNA